MYMAAEQSVAPPLESGRGRKRRVNQLQWITAVSHLRARRKRQKVAETASDEADAMDVDA